MAHSPVQSGRGGGRQQLLTAAVFGGLYLASERYLAPSSSSVLEQLFPPMILSSSESALLHNLLRGVVLVMLSEFLGESADLIREQALEQPSVRSLLAPLPAISLAPTTDAADPSSLVDDSCRIDDAADHDQSSDAESNDEYDDDDDEQDPIDREQERHGAVSTSSQQQPQAAEAARDNVAWGLLQALPILPLIVPVFELLTLLLLALIPRVAAFDDASNTVARLLLYNAKMLEASSSHLTLISLVMAFVMLCCTGTVPRRSHSLDKQDNCLQEYHAIESEHDLQQYRDHSPETQALAAEVLRLRRHLEQEQLERQTQVLSLQRDVDCLTSQLARLTRLVMLRRNRDGSDSDSDDEPDTAR